MVTPGFMDWDLVSSIGIILIIISLIGYLIRLFSGDGTPGGGGGGGGGGGRTPRPPRPPRQRDREVLVRVTSAGAPVQNAQVEVVRRIGANINFGITNATGEVGPTQLRLGTHRFRVTAPGYPQATVSANVGEGTGVQTIILTIGPANDGHLIGTVVNNAVPPAALGNVTVSWNGLTAQTNATGQYDIVIGAGNFTAGAGVVVEATLVGYENYISSGGRLQPGAQAQVTIMPGQTVTHDIQMVALPVNVTVVITEQHGAARIMGVLAQIEFDDGNGAGWRPLPTAPQIDPATGETAPNLLPFNNNNVMFRANVPNYTQDNTPPLNPGIPITLATPMPIILEFTRNPVQVEIHFVDAAGNAINTDGDVQFNCALGNGAINVPPAGVGSGPVPFSRTNVTFTCTRATNYIQDPADPALIGIPITGAPPGNPGTAPNTQRVDVRLLPAPINFEVHLVNANGNPINIAADIQNGPATLGNIAIGNGGILNATLPYNSAVTLTAINIVGWRQIAPNPVNATITTNGQIINIIVEPLPAYVRVQLVQNIGGALTIVNRVNAQIMFNNGLPSGGLPPVGTTPPLGTMRRLGWEILGNINPTNGTLDATLLYQTMPPYPSLVRFGAINIRDATTNATYRQVAGAPIDVTALNPRAPQIIQITIEPVTGATLSMALNPAAGWASGTPITVILTANGGRIVDDPKNVINVINSSGAPIAAIPVNSSNPGYRRTSLSVVEVIIIVPPFLFILDPRVRLSP